MAGGFEGKKEEYSSRVSHRKAENKRDMYLLCGESVRKENERMRAEERLMLGERRRCTAWYILRKYILMMQVPLPVIEDLLIDALFSSADIGVFHLCTRHNMRATVHRALTATCIINRVFEITLCGYNSLLRK